MSDIYKTTQQTEVLLRTKKVKKYPFEKLEPGLSFFIKIEDVDEGSLRAIVSNASLKKGKVYKCIKHTEEGYFEVTQVADDKVVVFTIVEASELAKNQTFATQENILAFFDELPEGKSYIIPFAKAKERTVKVACTRNSKRLNSKFVLISHAEYGIHEIYHVPKEAVTKPVQFFDPSPEAVLKG